MNDSAFVEGFRQQDPAAVRHLSECLLPSLWRFVYFRTHGDRHLAEDIISESVLALVKAVSASDVTVISPGPWLRGVAAHKIQDHFIAAARVRHLVEQAIAEGDQKLVPDPAAQEELNERRASVRKVMDGLVEQHRMVLEWKYIDRLSVREIATRLATTEKAAESILFRARRDFRDGLGEFQHDEDAFCRDNQCRECGDRVTGNGSMATSVAKSVKKKLERILPVSGNAETTTANSKDAGTEAVEPADSVATLKVTQ